MTIRLLSLWFEGLKYLGRDFGVPCASFHSSDFQRDPSCTVFGSNGRKHCHQVTIGNQFPAFTCLSLE